MVVTTAALNELDPVWKLHPRDISAALFDVLPPLIDKWGTAAASTAADWYDNLRENADVKGRFQAIVPPLDELGPEALAGWGSQPLNEFEHPANLDQPSGLHITHDGGPGGLIIDEQTAVDSAQSRVEGGVQKRLVNAANLTVTTSANEDPQARGYMRRTRPGACKFCLMVASRPAVYTKKSATFACHEHCYCEAVPAWGGQALPVRPYKPSDRPSTAADRARVRKWIAKNL